MKGTVWCTMCVLAICMAAVTLGAQKPKTAAQPANDDGPVARLKDAPLSSRTLKNPLENNPQAIAAGKKLFQRHCESCHGAQGYGQGRAADLHDDEIKSAPPGVLFWAITNGRLRKGMPAWSGLPDAQRWQLVAYLKSLN